MENTVEGTQKMIEKLLLDGQELIMQYGLKLLGSVVLFFVAKFTAKFVRKLTKEALRKAKVEETLCVFIGNASYILVLGIAAISIIRLLGVETTSFITLIGAVGLAVGLAFQGSLSNFASGLLLVIFRPFKIGDFIEAAEVEGTVKEIQFLTTTIVTLDLKKVIIPNSKLLGDNIINYTSEPMRRVDLTAGVSYDTDIRVVAKILKEVCLSCENVIKDKEPVIAVAEMADSSVNFIVRPWCKPEHYWEVYYEIPGKIKIAFDDAGIEIPFPQRDVHLYQMDDKK